MNGRLNSNQIKIIAIIAMTIDHAAWMLFPGYPSHGIPVIMHIIGRITCPIMCYCIAEGYHHTKNINRYTGRLFLFALVSHFAYVYFSPEFVDWTSFIPFSHGQILNQTSVMWPLAWGLVMLRIADHPKIRDPFKAILVILICLITFPSDWSCIASLCILAIGTNRGNFKIQMLWMVFYVVLYAIVYFFALDPLYGLIQMGVVLAIPIIGMYNGQRGTNPAVNKLLKWGFYLYYPIHLVLFRLLQTLQA